MKIKLIFNLPLVGGKANVEGKLDIDDVELKYSKTCLKQPLKNRQNKDLNGKC